jgi:hypothetical protein
VNLQCASAEGHAYKYAYMHIHDSDELLELVKPLRIELVQESGPVSRPAMVLNVEPMLLLSELSKHMLLTAHPPPGT